MRFPRFKIRTLLGVVLCVAIAVAALRASTDAWDGWLFALTSVILLTAILLAIHRTDRRRGYWLGFALFGWAYLTATLIPPIGSRLPTTMGLASLDSLVRPRRWILNSIKSIDTGNVTWAYPSFRGVAFSPDGRTVASASPGKEGVWDSWSVNPITGPGGTTENFVRIGHSLLALLMAFVGGPLSRYLYRTGQAQSSSAQPVSTSPPCSTITRSRITPRPPLLLQRSNDSSGSLCLSSLIVHFLG